MSFYPSIAADTSRNTSKITRGISSQKYNSRRLGSTRDPCRLAFTIVPNRNRTRL